MIVKKGKSPQGSKKAPKSGGSEKKAGKVKVKEEPAEVMLENLKAAGISKELLNKQPLKSFMQRAQHELRVYIALENAWPRKRNNVIEKREVPERIIAMTASKYEVYQTKTFKKLFSKVWKDDGLHELMIKQVRISVSSVCLCICVRTLRYGIGVQGRGSAQAGHQAEGKEGGREGVPAVSAAQGGCKRR